MPKREKQFIEGLNLYRQGQFEAALDVFLPMQEEEAGAAVLAAIILAESATHNAPTAARLLERVLQAEEGQFPTPLMEKYLPDSQMQINITPSLSVTLPISMTSISLLLVEMYQVQGRLEEALGLLEELDELTEGEVPVIVLSLCELYALVEQWDGIIERAQDVQEVTDDVSLEIMLFYGRAMQEKELHDAAIAVYTKALRKRKGLNPALRQEGRYWRAKSYEAVGKRSRARQEYQKLFAENPDFRDVAEIVGEG